MRGLRAAGPMLFNAAMCWAIYHYLHVGHDFTLGACCGGSVLMALRDAEHALECGCEEKGS